MAITSFNIDTYRVYLYRDGTGSGASSSFDSIVSVKGEGNIVNIYFLNSDTITSNNYWSPATKYGRIYMRHRMLSIIIDILRNENPVFCTMSDNIPGLCKITTSIEPIGEEET